MKTCGKKQNITKYHSLNIKKLGELEQELEQENSQVLKKTNKTKLASPSGTDDIQLREIIK